MPNFNRNVRFSADVLEDTKRNESSVRRSVSYIARTDTLAPSSSSAACASFRVKPSSVPVIT